MWTSTLLSPYLHPKLGSLYGKLCKSPCQCGVHIGLYTLSSRQGLCMGCCITKGVTKQCIVRLRLTISRTTITMPDIAYVSIFTDNDLTHITEDHFEIKLIARLLNQIYVVQPPMLPLRYDDAPPGEYEYS